LLPQEEIGVRGDPRWGEGSIDREYLAAVGHEKEDEMKMAFAVLALCACTQGALAAGPDCRAIDSTTERLACYDTAYPRPKVEKPAVVEGDRTAYKDPFLAEEVRTHSKLNNICRGC
jgi:hypothetical protein